MNITVALNKVPLSIANQHFRGNFAKRVILNIMTNAVEAIFYGRQILYENSRG